MPLGPQKLAISTANLIKFAESTIDTYISNAKFYPVCVPTDALGINYAEFSNSIAPAYIKAGWRIVEWRKDRNNNRWYIYLSL